MAERLARARAERGNPSLVSTCSGCNPGVYGSEVGCPVRRFLASAWRASHDRFGPGVVLQVQADPDHVPLSDFRCEVRFDRDPTNRVAVASHADSPILRSGPSNRGDFMYAQDFRYLGTGEHPPWPAPLGTYRAQWWGSDFSVKTDWIAPKVVFLGEDEFAVKTGDPAPSAPSHLSAGGSRAPQGHPSAL
jgi:hypothetical protein